MSRIYIGGLPTDADKNEIEREFEHFGALRDVWIARNPPGFGFVVFEDSRDAEDAVRGLDGKRLMGSRIRVEFARSGSRGGRGRGGRGRGGGYNNYRSYGDRGGDRYSGRSSGYRDRSRSPDHKRRRYRSRSSSYDRKEKRKENRDRSRSKSPSQ